MRKILLLLISCMFISIGIQAQTLDNISLNHDDITLNVGESVTLEVIFDPPTTSDKVVSWKINDVADAEGIVSIDSTSLTDKWKCIVTAGTKEGEATITVKGKSGALTVLCNIKVVKLVTAMELNETAISMFLGEDSVLRAITTPDDVTKDSIIWVSRDSSIVSILSTDANRFDTACYIKALKPGEVWIVAKTVDGGFEDSCKVTVASVPITSFTLNNDSIKILKGEEATIIAQIRPLIGTFKEVNWINTNFPGESIIEIIPPLPGFTGDTICRIKAKGPGEAKIVAVAFDGQKDTCVITVETLADSVVMNYKTITLDLYTDSMETLTARIYPAVAINKNLTWSSSDANLVKIDSVINDSLGYIKALRAGTAVIYAITDNNKKDSCIVTVSPRLIDSLKLNKSSLVNDTLVLQAGDLSTALEVTIFPWNATNDTIKYESSDPNVARIDTISNSVFIKALSRGTAIIYAKAIDGSNKKDSIIVKVNSIPVTGLSLNADTIRLYRQSIDSLIASFLPVNTTNKSVVWSTNDNSVVRIESSTGTDTICKFTVIKADTALIYAVSSEDGAIKDSCVVIVKERFVFLESNTTTADGKIELSITIPAGISFTTASYELQLPKGFGLTKDANGYKSSLTTEAGLFADLQIDYVNDSTYVFNITPKTNLTINPGTGVPLKIMDIYYTIYDNALEGKTEIYKAKFNDITIALSDATTVNEEHVVNIKVFKDATANDIFDGSNESFAYIVDGRLYVKSDKAETVYVYSLSGSLIYMKDKTEGPAVFDIKTQEKILIVKGSSGWAVKVANK